MASNADIALAVEQLRAVINPMGWDIVAQDLRGDTVNLAVERAKSAIGPGGGTPAAPPAESLPAGSTS
jgi:hypothetical protein